MKWYENKIFDTEELLKELELAHIVKTSDKKEEEIKDCQYCCGDVDGRDYILSNGSEGVYIDGNGKSSGDDDLDFDDKKLNYCPICGRKF